VAVFAEFILALVRFRYLTCSMNSLYLWMVWWQRWYGWTSLRMATRTGPVTSGERKTYDSYCKAILMVLVS